jgi:hypothetical protein
MGIEIQITVPHNIRDFSPANVAAAFRTLDEVFEEISRYYAQHGIRHPSRAWTHRDTEYYQDSYRHRPVGFDAPAGFSFDFGPHTVSILPQTRLGLFCTEPVIRNLIRKFTHQTLMLMSGARAIYSPDDYGIYDLIFDGQTFTQIETHLLRPGKPAPSFSEFDTRQSRPDHYYYIDRFEDFCEAGAA